MLNQFLNRSARLVKVLEDFSYLLALGPSLASRFLEQYIHLEKAQPIIIPNKPSSEGCISGLYGIRVGLINVDCFNNVMIVLITSNSI